MKNFYSLLFFSVLSITSFSQIPRNAIGLRSDFPGQITRAGIEVSYQDRITDVVRIELGLGLQRAIYSTKYANFVTTVQGVWNLKEGLNWYIGIGFQVGYFEFERENDDTTYLVSGFGGGIPMQLGLEYNFTDLDLPFLLSLETRPLTPLVNDFTETSIGVGFAFALRYIINNED